MSKKDRFYIAQIEEEKKEERKPSKFVSPYSGTSAKDEYTYPYVKYDNAGRQYSGLNGKEELDMIYTDREHLLEKKKQKEEDKYSPDRIPSYYRKEENLGINRNNLADLRGDKLSEEEIIERNRRQYGSIYHNAMREADQAQEIRRQERNEQYNNYRPDTLIQDPLNANNNPKYDFDNQQPNYSFDSTLNQNNYDNKNSYEQPRSNQPINNYNQPTNYQSVNNYEQPRSYDEVSNYGQQNNYQNKSVEVKYDEPIRTEQVNQNIDFFRLEEKEEVKNNNDLTKVGYNEVKVQPEAEPVRPLRTRTIENVHAPKDLFFGNPKAKFVAPPLEILKRNGKMSGVDGDVLNYQISTINRTLEDFKVGGKVITYTKGPTVTQFEVKLDPGVNVNKVTTIQKNLQMNLASESIRIQAPIPGKSTIGIEAPNAQKDIVLFGDLVSNEKFLKDGKPLNVILGLSISGEPIYANIGDMPHALVAGKTGSGKSVCVYSIIGSMLYKASPEEVKMILIDPKGNELIFFSDIPHLATPIIDDPKLAAASLKWAVDEMERRYDFLKANRKRTIGDYNVYAKANGMKTIPYIVIIIDEFADLMNTVSESFEINVQRLTQKARSAGIHVIVATQRPTTDVIKGTIKANIPTRIAFSVQSQTDSLTILDHVGAEKLLGKGDMLFTKGSNDIRIQGSFISEAELDALEQFYFEQNVAPNYMFTHDELQREVEQDHSNSAMGNNDPFEDEYFEDVARFVFRQRKASANQIQKTYEIGFNRANKIIIGLAELGVIESENVPGRARAVIINDIEELEELLKNRF